MNDVDDKTRAQIIAMLAIIRTQRASADALEGFLTGASTPDEVTEAFRRCSVAMSAFQAASELEVASGDLPS